jgi:hypothetical protein
MSMPVEWVESLFRRFLGVYGNRFTRMWDGVDPEIVKATWSEELGRINPEAIRYALEHLPETNPPTVLEFRRLCLAAPQPATLPPQLPAPPADPARLAKELAPLREAIQRRSENPREWAEKLRARERACERLTPAQRQAWRDAIRAPQVAAICNEFTPVPVESLPPSMR